MITFIIIIIFLIFSSLKLITMSSTVIIFISNDIMWKCHTCLWYIMNDGHTGFKVQSPGKWVSHITSKRFNLRRLNHAVLVVAPIWMVGGVWRSDISLSPTLAPSCIYTNEHSTASLPVFQVLQPLFSHILCQHPHATNGKKKKKKISHKLLITAMCLGWISSNRRVGRKTN